MSDIKPKVKEVKCEVSVGGKVQLVKYEQSGAYQFALARVYEGDWTEKEAAQFQSAAMVRLREEIEPHAQAEYEALMDARQSLNK